MQPRRLLFIAAFSLLLPLCLRAQQIGSEPVPAPAPSTPPDTPAQPNAQGSSLFQQTLAAVGGPQSATDITLTGSITVLTGAGKTDTGKITLVARGDTAAQVTMNMASGTRTEVRSISPQGIPSETWTGPDGTVRHNPVQSLLTPHPAWFHPQFVLTAQPQSLMGSSFVASEPRNGATVNHLRVWELPQSTSSAPAALLQAQTQYDLYLDPATSLPAAMVFYVQADTQGKPLLHPAVSRNTRVSVEIRYSDYVRAQGILVANHIQAFVQGRQIYDIQLSSVATNTGVAIASAN